MERRRRNNFLARVIVSTICLVGILGLVYLFTPDSEVNLVLFFALVFLGSFFISSLIWNHLRRSLFSAIFILGIFLFRFVGVGGWLNIALLGAFLATVEVYLTKYK
jgi:hypothetical protein